MENIQEANFQENDSLLWFREKINYKMEKGFRVVCKL